MTHLSDERLKEILALQDQVYSPKVSFRELQSMVKELIAARAMRDSMMSFSGLGLVATTLDLLFYDRAREGGE